MILRGEAYLHLVEYQYPFIPEKNTKNYCNSRTGNSSAVSSSNSRRRSKL